MVQLVRFFMMLIGISLMFIIACKKKEVVDPGTPTTYYALPVLSTISVNNVTETAASSGGNIISDGGAAVTARGICWNLLQMPTVSNSTTIDGKGTGIFTSSITGLLEGTTFYVRAYATNSAGTGYGDEVSFTTLGSSTLPLVSTTIASGITDTSALSGGNVSYEGGAAVTTRGVCWSTSQAPTIADSKTTDGAGAGIFTSSIMSLSANTTYYVRAYATNSFGTGYGNEHDFTTAADTTTLQLGASYQGGIIFYIDGTGQHGLISAPSDQGTVNWGCEGTFISGTSTLLGTGQANTTAIVGACGTPGIGARICDTLTLGGYTDWYLPSKDELNLMHQNLHLQSLGNFLLFRYWSSSQYDAQFAWCQLFNLNLNQLFYDKDLIAYRIRAVRDF